MVSGQTHREDGGEGGVMGSHNEEVEDLADGTYYHKTNEPPIGIIFFTAAAVAVLFLLYKLGG